VHTGESSRRPPCAQRIPEIALFLTQSAKQERRLAYCRIGAGGDLLPRIIRNAAFVAGVSGDAYVYDFP
jgi:hypothetical protein